MQNPRSIFSTVCGHLPHYGHVVASENCCLLLRIMLQCPDLPWLAPLQHCWLNDWLLECRHHPCSRHRLNFAPRMSIFTISMKVSSLELTVPLIALYFGKDTSSSSSVKPKSWSQWTFLSKFFLRFHLEASHAVICSVPELLLLPEGGAIQRWLWKTLLKSHTMIQWHCSVFSRLAQPAVVRMLIHCHTPQIWNINFTPVSQDDHLK